MKYYLAIFTGNAATMAQWDRLSKKTRQEREAEGMKVWGEWVKKNKKNIVEVGHPLGKTKLINKKGIFPYKNKMTAWTLVKASSHQAAAALFKKHPHFSIFPGYGVEVMECLDLSKM